MEHDRYSVNAERQSIDDTWHDATPGERALYTCVSPRLRVWIMNLRVRIPEYWYFYVKFFYMRFRKKITKYPYLAEKRIKYGFLDPSSGTVNEQIRSFFCDTFLYTRSYHEILQRYTRYPPYIYSICRMSHGDNNKLVFHNAIIVLHD